jgi:hypothetical protein
MRPFILFAAIPPLHYNASEEDVMSQSGFATWKARSAVGTLATLLAALAFLLSRPSPELAGPSGPAPGAYLFLSPNTEEQLTVADALQRLQSPIQADFRSLAGAILDQLRIGVYTVRDGVGDWGDGAENSILVEFSRPADEPTLRYAAAWFGLLAEQKYVLTFRADPTGSDAVLDFDLPIQNLSALRRALDRQGISSRTLVPHSDGCHIVIFDVNRLHTAQLQRSALAWNVLIRVTPGRGLTVGDPTRIGARQLYHREIRRYEKETTRKLEPDRLPIVVRKSP